MTLVMIQSHMTQGNGVRAGGAEGASAS